jgi:hypothetical protein
MFSRTRCIRLWKAGVSNALRSTAAATSSISPSTYRETSSPRISWRSRWIELAMNIAAVSTASAMPQGRIACMPSPESWASSSAWRPCRPTSS